MSESQILAHGPLFKQRSTVAYREVLRRLHEGGYVVHHQYFPDYPTLDRDYFGSGDYFSKSRFDVAMRRFADRVATHSWYVGAIEGELP